jgi:hypothetical protein
VMKSVVKIRDCASHRIHEIVISIQEVFDINKIEAPSNINWDINKSLSFAVRDNTSHV